jgi:hypothetical protein
LDVNYSNERIAWRNQLGVVTVIDRVFKDGFE